MMDRPDIEESIHFIKKWKEDTSSAFRKFMLNNTLEALEALKKQIPEKPEKIGARYEWHCPTCKSFLCDENYIFSRSNYCPACGQALDWEVDDGT